MFRIIAAIVAGCLGVATPCRSQQAQTQDTTVLLVAGDLNRPHEVLRAVFQMWAPEVDVTKTYEQQWATAVGAGLEAIRRSVRALGGNALVNMQIVFSARPPREGQVVRGGEAQGVVLIYGTAVRLLGPGASR